MKKASKNLRLSSPVRLSFPHVWEPSQLVIQGKPTGDPQYSCGLVIANTQQQLVQEMIALQQELVGAAWPDGNIPADFHWAMNPGSIVRPNDPHLADAYLINAKAKPEYPPQIYQRNPQNPSEFIQLTDRTAIYSGCEAWVAVSFFTYQTTPTKGGIGCALNMIMPTGRDVGRYDGRMTADQAFGDLPPDTGMMQPPGGFAQQPAATPQATPQGPPGTPQATPQGGGAYGPTGPPMTPPGGHVPTGAPPGSTPQGWDPSAPVEDIPW